LEPECEAQMVFMFLWCTWLPVKLCQSSK